MILLKDFLGSQVVKAPPSNAWGAGSSPSQGAKILQATPPKNQNVNSRSTIVTIQQKLQKWSTLKKKYF